MPKSSSLLFASGFMGISVLAMNPYSPLASITEQRTPFQEPSGLVISSTS